MPMPSPDKCQKCGGVTRVVDTRPNREYIWRRRQCVACGHRFSSIEVTADMAKVRQATRYGA